MHLCAISALLFKGHLDKANVKSIDKTLFTINVYNGTTFGLDGNIGVKYADVLKAEEAFTISLRLSNGKFSRI